MMSGFLFQFVHYLQRLLTGADESHTKNHGLKINKKQNLYCVSILKVK